MAPDTTIRIPQRLKALAATAVLLERLDRTPRSASAGQYRALVRQLDGLLDEADEIEGDPGALHQLLEYLPSLAEVHENRHYAAAGLCRAPLEAAAESELAARELLQRVRARR